MSYLDDVHSMVFSAVPRPGGLAIIPPQQGYERKEKKDDKSGRSRSNKSISNLRSTKSLHGVKSSKSMQKKSLFETSFMSTPGGYVPREGRIKLAMETVPWAFFGKSHRTIPTIPEPPNPLQDSIDILAIVISTIMLLAADQKEIPINNLRWTLSYLECVKDEVGNCPPNVVGIINHIKSIDETIESLKFEMDDVLAAKKDRDASPSVTFASSNAPPPSEAPAPPEPAVPDEQALLEEESNEA